MSARAFALDVALAASTVAALPGATRLVRDRPEAASASLVDRARRSGVKHASTSYDPTFVAGPAAERRRPTQVCPQPPREPDPRPLTAALGLPDASNAAPLHFCRSCLTWRGCSSFAVVLDTSICVVPTSLLPVGK